MATLIKLYEVECKKTPTHKTSLQHIFPRGNRDDMDNVSLKKIKLLIIENQKSDNI